MGRLTQNIYWLWPNWGNLCQVHVFGSEDWGKGCTELWPKWRRQRLQADRVTSLSGWFPHVFCYLKSVIKLGQLPITEFKVASHSVPVSDSVPCFLLLYFLEIMAKGYYFSLHIEYHSRRGAGSDILALKETVSIWCCTKGSSIHKRNHLETRGVCVLPLIPFISSHFRHTQNSRRLLWWLWEHFEAEERLLMQTALSPWACWCLTLQRCDSIQRLYWMSTFLYSCLHCSPSLWDGRSSKWLKQS